jgi:hypothetical protein
MSKNPRSQVADTAWSSSKFAQSGLSLKFAPIT